MSHDNSIDTADYVLPGDLHTRLMTPALVIFESRVRRNVATMLSLMHGDPARWRPHLKTTKSPRVWRELVTAGVRAFKCATVREAQCLLELLHESAIEGADLLIAYPLQGPSMCVAGELARQYPAISLSVLSEDPQHAAAVPASLGVFIDVNPGMNRTGIQVTDTDRIAATVSAAGRRWRGIHYYDGHIHDATADQRRRCAHAVYDTLLEGLRAMDAFAQCREIITSGTPTFQYALDYPGFAGGRVDGGTCLHRVSPGTVVFHDEQSAAFEDLPLAPAALVLTRVISHPDDHTVTCDAGSKSLAAEAGDPVAAVMGRADLVARKPSEEHLPLTRTDLSRTAPALGDLLMLVPRHVCPTVNLAEQAVYIGADGSCDVIDIAARAHPLMYTAEATR